MVGLMDLRSGDDAASLLNSAKFAMDIPSKLQNLSQLNEDLSYVEPQEFLPQLLELLSDRFSPVRKLVTKMIGEIGSKHIELLPEIVPALLAVLQDGTPAVARQAIACGIHLFHCTLGKVAIQGLITSELEESIVSSWEWMLKLKEKFYSLAFQAGVDGIRLPALKFVEAVILLYAPDPNGSLEPPSYEAFDGNLVEFNMSWLRGRHPLLDAGDLSVEASRSLRLLLDLLRSTTVNCLSNSMMIVLINSLSAIANKRPTFYGRILPALLGLDPSYSAIKGNHVFAVRHALKNAFLRCLKCTHPGAVPWRDRLVGALRGLEAVTAEVALPKCNGSLEGEKSGSLHLEEEMPPLEVSDDCHGNTGRKRSGTEEVNQLKDDDDSGKRVKPTPVDSEVSSKELNEDLTSVKAETPMDNTTSNGDGVNGHVQQLVSMFSVLVAQGEKAVTPLEILISSISSDLLAEVVMANMRHLPCHRPYGEDEKFSLDMKSHANIMGSDAQNKDSSSFLTHILSLSRILPHMASPVCTQASASTVDLKSSGEEVDLKLTAVSSDEFCGGMESEAKDITVSTSSLDTCIVVDPPIMENEYSGIPGEMHDVGNAIPGLDSTAKADLPAQTPFSSALAFADLEDSSQEQASSADRKSLVDQLPCMSTDRSEEHSPKASVIDFSGITSSTATSVGFSYQIVLPKMSAPVIDLADEEKDRLQTLAFTRIIEAYKQIIVAGGSKLRSSLLASIGLEFPLELDPWKLLQKHILSDYVNFEGHELTLRVLYRLFGVAEEQDFFSSTTATSTYEMFLLTVAETLRDSFPASDKSLTRLLGEVPYLPKSVFNLLECLCSPVNNDRDEKGLQCGDRVTQGLSAVWSLILLRPPIRDECLNIALQSAVHHLEEVRMKAIRLVANKLYSLSSIAQHIEDFAKKMLFSVANGGSTIDRADEERLSSESLKDSNLEKSVDEHPSVSISSKDICSEPQPSTPEMFSSSSMSEAQRCMSLYFALCTKKHSLFRQIFVTYRSASKAVKQAVHRHIPILVRTMGSSPDLLEIISDPPAGSENLLMQVLHTLTDGTAPSPALIVTVKKLYDSKLKDVEILMPILSFLPKEEVLCIFPHIVNLPLDKFQAALARVMQGSSQSSPVLAPAEVLIAIHGIDPDRDGIPLKKVTDACNACFDQRQTFTQQVLAKVLNQLVEQIPLPLLFMRTVIQAIGAFPGLVDFIMEILSRLVSKQIWKYPKLWVGFLKCAFLTRPQSFSVLLQLPPAQLENALNRNGALKAPLVAHANQPEIRSSLPRSVLAVLGISSDSQTSSHTQATQAPTGDANNSDKDLVTEKTIELSGAN